MANAVKRNDQLPSRSVDTGTRSARLTLLMCLAGLAVLVTQLPGPGEALAAFTEAAAPVGAAAPLAAVQSILLITAGLTAWLLVVWLVIVVTVGLLARLPGRPGRRARRLLPRIAPAAIGRLVAAAAGVSLIAGTAACAAPGGAPAAGGVASTSATTTVSTAPATPSPATSEGSVTIDWPDPAAPTKATTTPTTESTETTATTAATTAISTSPESTTTQAPTTQATTTPSPAPTPDTPAPPAPQTEPAGTDEQVTVQPGDSLWRIAADSLGPQATASDIDNAWRAWYFVNQEVIGDDPDVIEAGQSLRAPAPGQQVRS